MRSCSRSRSSSAVSSEISCVRRVSPRPSCRCVVDPLGISVTGNLGNDRVARNLLMLPRLLRRAGVHVNAERARVYLQAITEVGLERPDDMRAASRTALISRQSDLAPFEMTFDLFWSLLRGGTVSSPVPSSRRPKPDTA